MMRNESLINGEKPKIAIVGCGRVGSALAQFLSHSGYPIVGAASRSPASAERAAQWNRATRTSVVPWEVTRKADLVFICTPDGSIETVSEAICANNGFSKGAVVLHCSGALPSSVMSSARRAAVHIGSLHPLQSFASHTFEANPFRGIVMSAEGDDRAVATARTLAEDLDATCFEIKTEAKTLYHAAAVVASNYLVTLLDLSLGLLTAAGIPETDGLAVLDPLIRGTLGNVSANGTAAALTGPIARADIDTVDTHLAAIGNLTPAYLDLYKALGLQTVAVARAGGHISENRARELEKKLG